MLMKPKLILTPIEGDNGVNNYNLFFFDRVCDGIVYANERTMRIGKLEAYPPTYPTPKFPEGEPMFIPTCMLTELNYREDVTGLIGNLADSVEWIVKGYTEAKKRMAGMERLIKSEQESSPE